MTPRQNSCFGLMVTGVVTNSPDAGLTSGTLREGLGTAPSSQEPDLGGSAG